MNKRYLPLLFILFLLWACKKVEKNNDFLRTVYSVITESNLYREDGSFFFYQYAQAGKTLVPGDTIMIAGILGGRNARRTVQIGDSTLEIFNQAPYRIYNTSTKDTIWADVDYLQCRIPKSVATGNSVPVTVTVNGISIPAPGIKIQQYSNIPSATDTTLVVEKVGEWLPQDLTPYKGTSFKLWEGGMVTNAGNIWFYNKPEGIFRITNGVVKQVLAPNVPVTPVTGTPFRIVYLTGFTVDIDETVIYFACSSTEDTPDAGLYYITRFCKMDPASGKVTVLNRSTFMKRAAQYPRAADLATPLYDPSYNYMPAEGNLANVKMSLSWLQLALDGTLYAANNTYNTTITPKSPLAGDPRFPQFSDPAFYAQRDSLAARSWYGYGSGDIAGGMGNFICIKNDEVRSLAKRLPSMPVAGAEFYYRNQQLSPDGRFLYQVDVQQHLLNTISTEDFEQDSKGTPGSKEFSFSSMDTSSVTGLHTPSIQLDDDRFASYYVLSNGDAVFFPSDYQGVSLLGVNFAANNAYVYGGTEQGLKVNPFDGIAGQTKSAGLAKWVNFSPKTRSGGYNFFVGFDRRNQLYFVSTASLNYGAQHLPLQLYRIKKP